MRKTISLLLALVLMLSCAVTLMPAAAKADSVYIIPDSNTRELTEAELWEYQYDTLLFAFNEILARNGYKFETGSRCYNWFTLMPWYTPNESENSQNHSESYNKTSKLEWNNINLIKKVRKDMREQKTTNPKGKGMPTPPSRNLAQMQGFTPVTFTANQNLAVYSAPSADSYRAANGKASVSTNGAVYTMGVDSGWLLVIYETNSNQCRVGYVDISKIKGKVPALNMLSFAAVPCETIVSVGLTDDPAMTGKPLIQLAAGTQVTYLTTMYNSGAWDYIETTINGQRARGFVPSGSLSIDEAEEFDAVDAMEQMDEDEEGL